MTTTEQVVRDCFNNIIQYAHKPDFVVLEAKNGLFFLNAAPQPGNGDGVIDAGSGKGADPKSDLPPPAVAAPMGETPKTDAKIPAPPKRHTATFWRSEFFMMTGHAKDLERENQRFRNGFANLSKALQDGPGLPIELLDEADQAKWTDTITGILMALGVLEVTGKPMNPFEALTEAAKSV